MLALGAGAQHHLSGLEAAGGDDTTALMQKLRGLPVNDVIYKNGVIRPDGRERLTGAIKVLDLRAAFTDGLPSRQALSGYRL